MRCHDCDNRKVDHKCSEEIGKVLLCSELSFETEKGAVKY